VSENPPRSNTPPPPLHTDMDVDDPLPPSNEDPVGVNVWREWWRQDKEDYDERLMNRAKEYGLRRLRPDDHLPPELRKRVEEWGSNILIRPGPELCPEQREKRKNDPLRSCFEHSIGVDPNMGTFLVCVCPWTGDEYWIGFGQSTRIGTFLDRISAIQSEISKEVDKDEKVLRQVRVCHEKDDILINSIIDSQAAYKGSVNAKSDLLKLKASIVKEKTVRRQEEIDSLWAKINHIQQKLHTISAEFLSHWDLVAIPRFGLQKMIKRGGGNEMGDRQKAILSHLAHCKFLDRFHEAARKRGCDVVEVGEAGSTKNCSHCNSKNSPRFDRFYHCRNCKRKMTRDGNAALNIFKMALSMIMTRLKYTGIFPDPLFEPGDDSDGDDDDEDDSGEEGDEMNWEEEFQGLKDEEIAWAKDESELRMKKRKRDEDGDGVDTRERGAMRKSIVLSETGRGLRSALPSGFHKDIDPPLQF
jgi:Mg2+ and Co2+ transporter CorA